MTTSENILIKNHGNGRIDLTINRADKHNALSRCVLADLAQAVTAQAQYPQTLFVVIQGAGNRYFAAGGDLVDLSSVRSPEATKLMSDEARAALDTIRNCEVPVIACLNGDAIGGGAELSLACDMRVMTSTARIGYIHARLAITPAWGGGTDLCNLIGSARALRMMTRGEMIPADLALQWGLADAVLNDGIDGQDMQDFLAPLQQRSGTIMRCLKRQTVAARQGYSYAERREAEQQHLIETWTHEDHWNVADHILSKNR
ncbi:enoyl-CoA hydratase/isomerase family protein [Pusillimonas sp. MFBS29]|uniref:enoyl-CoA hydratase/isomerase family protein n=1 Tax=Pusillimonas sp. MFBS29 TaxID=2886690 RepID=UPI001D0FE509|nr:enoyl-CoA hydratase/isomerase family protein [Pusillimonas sp. MFBS29]MCC2595816.1 enoyl-CoA hydratase/isomerase family protein [Pusillimonas sp. MFBS29]